MRWNCPHCGVNLAIGDDKISGGWAFSRCYKCGGHALVRKAEISVIKVDRAPPGERLILPEASDTPNVGMNPIATQNYARTAAQAIANSSQAAATAAAMMAAAQSSAMPPGIPSYDPIPLMEVRGRNANASLSNRMLPVAMGIAGAMAVGSGFYLYVQGQNLWNKATRIAHAPNRERVRDVASESENSQSETMRTSQAAPAMDMAPAAARMNTPIAAQPAISVESAIIASNDKPSAISAEMLIKIKSPSTRLHSGPGLAFPVLGTANPMYSYKVVEWKDRWFRIAEMTEGKSLGWVRNDQVATQ